MKALLRVLLGLSTWSLVTFANTAAEVEKIDKLMTAYYEEGQLNGSVLVAKKGEVIYKKGFGLANVEWQIPNTPDTRFRLASITKQFTAMLIMQLVQQGKVSLEGTISDYLDYYRKDTGGKITVHQLLNHTSGIPSYTDDSDFMRNKIRQPMEVVPFIKNYCSGDFLTEPGTTYAYNNSGYCILGAIIEAVTGKTYEAVLQEQIFDPLGMAHSGYDHYEDIIPKRATGYEQRGTQFRHAPFIDMSLPYAAGSMYATVEDLYKWDRALYTEKLLSKALLDKMMTDYGSNYGYGFQIASMELSDGRTKQVVSHGGGIFGFRTIIRRMVDDEHLVVILCNGNRPGRADREIVKILYGLPFEMPKQSVAMAIKPLIQEGKIEQAHTRAKVLRADDAYELRESEINDMGYQFLGEKKLEQAIDVFKLNTQLFPDSANTYDSLGEAYKAAGKEKLAIENYSKSFEMDPSNRNAKQILEELGVDTAALEPEEVVVPAGTLQSYVGVYEIAPQFKLTFFLEDGRMMAQATGQSKAPIYAKSATRFYLKVVSAELEFQRNDQDEVESVTLYQGGRSMTGKKIE